MKKYFVLVLAFLFMSCSAIAKQDPYGKHIVKKGETIFQIASKYKITPFDIYRLNPDAKNGIQENSVLLIPRASASVDNNASDDKIIIHEVKSKETLYSIAKEYEVSVDDIKNWNQELLKDGLKTGQEIIVSKEKATVSDKYVEVDQVKTSTKTFTHVVQPKETLYGISKKYNIAVNDIIKQNPEIENGLAEGAVLKLKKVAQTIVTTVNDDQKVYTVQPKETLYGIAKQLQVTQEQLLELNPELKDGLREGMVLVLPMTSSETDAIYVAKAKVNLLDSANKKKVKNLVLLLPFNLPLIENSASGSEKEYIKKSNFLSLTIDFYSGAMMAIDSARVLGLPVNVKILDIESTKTTSNIAEVIKNNDFSKVNAVIGPFQNAHTETAAILLKKYNIPVISPLSKDVGVPMDNLYNSVPTYNQKLQVLFNYFKTKNGNAIAVISNKKQSTKDLLKSNYANQVAFANLSDAGSLDSEHLKSLLSKDKKNFVILESEKAMLIIQTTGLLMKLKSEYDIQLVVLELYDTLDFNEIPMKNLTELNLLFPSTKKETNLEGNSIFIKEYRKKNNVSPNAFAAKGFDVTFDTILRMCQEEGFEKSTQLYASEQFENSFDYVIQNGNILNNGVYLMYYDTDLTIKQAQ